MTARSMPYRNGVIRGMKTRVTPVGSGIAEGTAGSADTWVLTIFNIQLQPIGSLKAFRPHSTSVGRCRLDRAFENPRKLGRYRTGGVRFELLPIRWWTPAGWQSQQFL